MRTTKQVEKLPFHESIVEAIRCATLDELKPLGRLIGATKIPQDHDKIIKMWNQRRRNMSPWDDESLRVLAGLLEQKQEAEEKAEDRKQAVAVSA